MTRIVTWNMNGWGRGTSHDRAWAFLLETLNPDIALLQEAQEAAIPDIPTEYSALFTPAISGKQFGSVILSRLGGPELQWEDNSRGAGLLPKSSELGPVTVTCLQARVPQGIGVVRPLRETFDFVLPLLGERYVVGGDLNTARQAHLAWPQNGHGDFWEDIESWGLNEPLPLGGREQQSYWGRWLLDKPPTLGNTLQDDHVFLDAETFPLVTECRVWDTRRVRELSDHGPIVVDLSD